MGVHSGKFGVIDGATSIMNWSLNDSHTPAENVVSGSLFGRIRNKAIRAWDGTYDQLVAQPTLLPGDSGAWKGYTAPDDDVSGVGVTYSGNVVVSQAQINWDWAGGANIMSNLTFVGDLVLTVGDDTVTDATIPSPLPVCGTKVEFSDDGTSYTELANVASAQLTLSCDVQDYVNSSTGCWTGRKAGPLDWTVALTVEDNIRTGIPDIGESKYWRLYVDATNFWQLTWGITRDFTGITVNTETGEIINYTLNIDMDGEVGDALGQVLAPDGTTRWWGVAPP